MKVFLPATAVMFFIGLILGGPGLGQWRREERTAGTGKRQRSLVDVVGHRPWNFENNGGGISRKGIGKGGGNEKEKKRMLKKERDRDYIN